MIEVKRDYHGEGQEVLREATCCSLCRLWDSTALRLQGAWPASGPYH